MSRHCSAGQNDLPQIDDGRQAKMADLHKVHIARFVGVTTLIYMLSHATSGFEFGSLNEVSGKFWAKFSSSIEFHLKMQIGKDQYQKLSTCDGSYVTMVSDGCSSQKFDCMREVV